jgi:enamine deaminase RidA (YjgF/YER057c/UK114 family)
MPPGYSQIIVARSGHIIFIAGQTALDQNGEIVGKDNFAMQASQVFRNLAVALQSVGCTAANLIKLTVFMAGYEMPDGRLLVQPRVLARISFVERHAIDGAR